MQRKFAPSWERPFTKSMIGRSRMRCTPSRTKRPCPKVMAAVKGLIAVPAFPSIKVASLTGIFPDVPETVMRFSARFSSNCNSKCFQCFHHSADVITVQQILNFSLSFSQHAQKQNSVGETLGTR